MFKRRRSRFQQATAVREKLPQQIDKLTDTIEKLSGKLEQLPNMVPSAFDRVPDALERLPRTLEKLPERLPKTLEKLPDQLEKLPRTLERLPDRLPSRARRTRRRRRQMLGTLALASAVAAVTFFVARAILRARQRHGSDTRFGSDTWAPARAIEPTATPPHGDEIDTSRLGAAGTTSRPRTGSNGTASSPTMPARDATESLRSAGVSRRANRTEARTPAAEPNFDSLAGLPVVDVDDSKIGEVEAVYYRAYRGEPEWIGIHTGLVDPKHVLVPVEGFTTGEKVMIPYTRQQIEGAPVAPEGELSEEQELLYYSHYNARREMAEGVSDDDTRLRVWTPSDAQMQQGSQTSSKSE
jgi:PRC-barrel domain